MIFLILLFFLISPLYAQERLEELPPQENLIVPARSNQFGRHSHICFMPRLESANPLRITNYYEPTYPGAAPKEALRAGVLSQLFFVVSHPRILYALKARSARPIPFRFTVRHSLCIRRTLIDILLELSRLDTDGQNERALALVAPLHFDKLYLALLDLTAIHTWIENWQKNAYNEMIHTLTSRHPRIAMDQRYMLFKATEHTSAITHVNFLATLKQVVFAITHKPSQSPGDFNEVLQNIRDSGTMDAIEHELKYALHGASFRNGHCVHIYDAYIDFFCRIENASEGLTPPPMPTLHDLAGRPYGLKGDVRSIVRPLKRWRAISPLAPIDNHWSSFV